MKEVGVGGVYSLVGVKVFKVICKVERVLVKL